MEKYEDVILTRHNGLGHILLNRPAALNAIDSGMVAVINDTLADWANDPAVKAVMIEGAGERAFCAGGDVIAVSRAGQAELPLAHEFFAAEYRLNRAIHLFEKPYIAFLDGFTMGGGVGLSVHGNHRIVTENTIFAMPETGIGLFPDVGGSHFLSRCPGEIGTYLGLTGARLKAADLLAIGLADRFLPASAREPLVAALQSADWGKSDAHDVVSDILAGLATDCGPATVSSLRPEIDRLFAGNKMEDIIARLQAEDSEFAAQSVKFLQGKSPTLLKVTLAELRRGREQDFDTNMRMEYRMARHGLRPGADFHEGVRALLIDKDKTPKWSPARLEEVTDAMVDAHFQVPEEGDLVFQP